MWWRTRHGRGPPARHHLLEQLPGPAEHPCRVPLAAAHTLAPLLSHVLVPTPTNVAGRSPSNNQVMHKTPGHTRRRPHSRGAAPISLGGTMLHRRTVGSVLAATAVLSPILNAAPSWAAKSLHQDRPSLAGAVVYGPAAEQMLSLIHISEPTRLGMISYA